QCAIHELAQLTADVHEHLEKFMIRLPDPAAETFQHAQNLVAEFDWKTNAHTQSLFLREGRARKIAVLGQVGNPRRLATGPDAPGQTDSRSKSALPGDGRELRNFEGGSMPEFHAAHFIGRTIDPPHRAHVPSSHFTQGLGDFAPGLLQIGGFGQDTAYGILHAKPLLKPLVLGNDGSTPKAAGVMVAVKACRNQSDLLGLW